MRRQSPPVNRRRGLAMALVLVSLPVAAVVLLALGSVGVMRLNLTNAGLARAAAVYAAEAGIAQAADRLATDVRWTEGVRDVPLSATQESRFSVRVTNNFFGLEPARAPDGTVVPVGNCYLLSTGTARGRYAREVAVMLHRELGLSFEHAIFATEDIHLAGGSTTDSYDSAEGPYAETASPLGGDIGTNSVEKSAIALGGKSRVNGTVEIGPGGDPSKVVKADPAYYETAVAMATPVGLPDVDIPTGVSSGNVVSDEAVTMTPGTYGEVKIGSGATLSLSSGTYVIDKLSLEGDSIVEVTSAPVRLYIRRDLTLSGGTLVNTTATPANVAFFLGPGVRNASITGGTTAHYVLYAPHTAVKVVGGGDLYGAIVAKSLSASGGSRFHYDADLRNGIGGPLQVFSWQRI